MEIINTNLQFKSNYKARSLNSIKRIILHHTAVSQLQSVEIIHNYHISKGYAGIGYHFYIRKDGKIYKGRPIEWEGAHTYKFNDDSIGICCEGNFEVEQMQEEQKQALIELLLFLKSKYNIQVIGKHKDYYTTNCPRKKFSF